MPSQLHEALVLLFRNRPTLAPELMRDALHFELPAFTEARIDSADLTEVKPAEYRADLVVLLLNGVPVYGIVIEVQLSRDPSKKSDVVGRSAMRSWRSWLARASTRSDGELTSCSTR